MRRRIVLTASVTGMLAVIAGAFAAHGLRPRLSPQNFQVWHTAVEYQFYHVFALLFLSLYAGTVSSRLVSLAYYSFTAGIMLFSGSLYLLACRQLIGWDGIASIGWITPMGGLLFIAGWALVALCALRNH